MQEGTRRQPRSEFIACRCTPLEAELIRALAAQKSRNVSEYLRRVALELAGEVLAPAPGENDDKGAS